MAKSSLRLSEFLDGRLSDERVAQLKAHVDGCDVCERFGADFATAVKLLRAHGKPAPLEDGVRDRLASALDEAT